MSRTQPISDRPVPRPASVLVIAILGIIWGGLGFGCNSFFLGTPFTGPLLERVMDEGGDAQGQPFASDFGRTRAEVVRWVLCIPAMLLSALAIVAGAGLLGMRRWARRLAVVCACGLLLLTAADSSLAVYDWASTREQIAEEYGPMGWLFASPFVFGLEAGSALLQVAFAVAVLVILLRRSVAVAFRERRPQVS